MKIDGRKDLLQKIQGKKQADEKQKTQGADPKGGKKDALAISSRAAELEKIMDKVPRRVSDPQKVAEMKQQIKEGRLIIDSKKLAEKMLSKE